ncbi:PREDICTED: uncharacterized protein LOC104822287 [Tarenaya hassleriana]|uniref:uncharacterized protein LOC104822287 n=1 Tax=Tarenaya hassleriana TaxID=28532 RepID=UPI00053C2A7C|nr:PREDICTED: uncharacterized protein LOC104822287 [Tarenaya hassleriana]
MNHTRRKKRLDPSLSRTDSSLSPEMPSPTKSPAINPVRVRYLLLLLSVFAVIYLFFFFYGPLRSAQFPSIPRSLSVYATRRRHLLFSIAASHDSWLRRSSYVRLWYSPKSTRALVFLDRGGFESDPSLPPVIVSEDVSRFPYTFPGGLRSAIRVARVVKEAVDRGDLDVRWFVFGDDDTLFFVDNLLRVLSKYDYRKWYYVGSNSESYDQNVRYSFDMAFGGGGFAISASLARVLAKVLDSCLMRYSHMYGSDSRIFSCLAELGVALTHEPGFHQIDIRGNLFGLLCAHPLSPLVSLHHLDAVDPIFPKLNRSEAMDHLMEAVNVDSTRILQQSVCYDQANSLTVSVVWGYAIQVYEGNKLLPDLLSLQKTFTTWRRGSRVQSNYMFNTRDYPRDPCERPLVFFLDGVGSDGSGGTWSNYTRHVVGNCRRAKVKLLEQIRILSPKMELDIEQMKSPRRHCCDISPSYDALMVINVRECMGDEIIAMKS